MDTDVFAKLDHQVVRMEALPEGSLTRVHLQSMTGRRNREDHSMRKLGRLLGEEDDDEDATLKKVLASSKYTGCFINFWTPVYHFLNLK